MSVPIRLSAASLLVFALAACQNGEAPPRSSAVSAASTLSDLHLSTKMPPPLALEQRAGAPAVLAQPIILRKMQPSLPQGGSARGGEAGTISLNFDKASLRSVIDAILGDALGEAYNVDERVDGVVTLVSPQKLGREEALEVLDAVLRLNGATLVKGDHLYRVVLAANARQSLPGPRAGGPQPGYAVSVYVPRHTAAASLQKLIEPLYQIAGALTADSDHNLLLVTGSAEERRALLEAAQLFDQDWLASQSVGIFPLQHVRPKQMAEELRGLFAAGGAAASSDQPTIRFSAIERLDAVMVVSLQSSGIDHAAEWIARLDQTGPGDRVLHVVPVHFANVQNVARLLSRLFVASAGGVETGNAALPAGTAGARFSTSANQAATAGTPQGAVGPGFPAGAGAAAGGFRTGAAGSGMAGGAGGFGANDQPLGKTDQADSDSGNDLSANGPRILADSASHALLVMANQTELRVIEEAMAKLDAKPAQILIEATIVEVTLNKELEYGVQYFLRGTKFAGVKDSSIGFRSSSIATSSVLAGIAPGFNGVIGTVANPSAILSAVNSVTDSKVLSSPQLLVTDSKEALLKVGTQTPLLTQSSQSTLSPGAPLVNSVEYHDTGVILRVLPRCNDADIVSLDIAQEVSEVIPSATATLTPNIAQRRIESSVTVQSGQTVMLGGLISENNSQGRTGLPPFFSIPLVGALFGDSTENRARTELVIFLTPHVLRDGDQAQRLTEELLSRLKSMQPVKE